MSHKQEEWREEKKRSMPMNQPQNESVFYFVEFNIQNVNIRSTRHKAYLFIYFPLHSATVFISLDEEYECMLKKAREKQRTSFHLPLCWLVDVFLFLYKERTSLLLSHNVVNWRSKNFCIHLNFFT